MGAHGHCSFERREGTQLSCQSPFHVKPVHQLAVRRSTPPTAPFMGLWFVVPSDDGLSLHRNGLSDDPTMRRRTFRGRC